jgi:hypothetical protein
VLYSFSFYEFTGQINIYPRITIITLFGLQSICSVSVFVELSVFGVIQIYLSVQWLFVLGRGGVSFLNSAGGIKPVIHFEVSFQTLI